MSAALLPDALAVDKFPRRETKQPETKTHNRETHAKRAIATFYGETYPHP